ncbi:hypothetical protein [Pseudoalteromonas denitrificans]|uniref:Uncharacterized protein n=1 Tax=Pseudoalteromonas denitrificans DSM 6059 TaxID=1123010 RepID=A0A1I1RNV6_9GAMM|nr:hypothetical protein [Pseudoalteromonas denitrificans]SFD33928.1 hypothetical protein SAMN02745724_04242 [Pseudoalteromonas denitrificans DSM 6059]
MKNDTFSIISRFHISSMSLALFVVLNLGISLLYSILLQQKELNIHSWMIVTLCIAFIWFVIFSKDWLSYYKLYKNENQLINDERFKSHSYRASKVSFVALIMSNFLLLFIDLLLFPLSGAFISIFSLFFGVSIYLLVHIRLELGA